jgi:hypothetical protein
LDASSGRRSRIPDATSVPAATSWFDQEPRLGLVGRDLLGRLLARGTYSWPVWLAVTVALAGAATAWRLWHPPDYEVTVSLLVTERGVGVSEAASEELETGALRALVERVAFSRQRMLALIARHPESFPPGGDTELALENLRDRLDVEIKQNEFMEWHERDDPPRSVQLAISYRDRSPEVAFRIANELGKLVVDTGQARTQNVSGRERTAADAALSQAGGRLEAEEAARRRAVRPAKTALGARQRLLEVARQATDAELAAAAGGEQTLRFELVDPGRIPGRFRAGSALLRGAVILVVLGMAGWLLAGAFDPRVLVASDITLAGLAVLGALPALPLAGGRAAGTARDAADDGGPAPRRENPGHS